LKRLRAFLRIFASFLARLIWLNAFVLIALLLIAGILSVERGIEILHLASQAVGFTHLYLPLLLCIVLLACASFFSASADRRSRISPRLSVIAAPLSLAAVPGILIAIFLHSILVFCWTLLVGLLLVPFLHWLRNQFVSNNSQAQRLTQRRLIITAVSASILSLLVLWICSYYKIYVSSSTAVLVLIPIWALTLSCLFIALPKACGMPSLAVVVPLFVALLGMHHDANVFPHRPSSADPERMGAYRPSALRSATNDQLKQWAKQFVSGPKHQTIPLYLVSAEGGGLRAADWAASVLSELDAKSNGDFRKHVFLLSGVSGGSLGIATFADAAYLQKRSPGELPEMMHRFFARDFLKSLAVPLFTTEPLRYVFGNSPIFLARDQAFEEFLASEWKADTGSDDLAKPFLGPFSTNYEDHSKSFIPITWFNSTVVETGLRAVVSNTDTRAVTSESLDLLAWDASNARGLDFVTTAQAIHLSARFPYVSPPATIQTGVLDSKDPSRRERRLWGHLVDGGYLDNSGSDGFVALLQWLNRARDLAISCKASRDCDPDSVAQQLFDVESRLQIIVITLRNDPLEKNAASVFAIPSLSGLKRDELLKGLSACGDCGFYKDGFLQMNLPLKSGSLEIAGPIDAMLTTRDARGSLTRDSVKTRVEDNSSNARFTTCRDRLFKALDQKRGLTKPDLVAVGLAGEVDVIQRVYGKTCSEDEQRLVAEWSCQLYDDEYKEYSLAESLDDAAKVGCGSDGESIGNLREIALGWTLDNGAREKMYCLAQKTAIPKLTSDVRVGLPASCWSEHPR